MCACVTEVGAFVPLGRRSRGGCGASERVGWSGGDAGLWFGPSPAQQCPVEMSAQTPPVPLSVLSEVAPGCAAGAVSCAAAAAFGAAEPLGTSPDPGYPAATRAQGSSNCF